MFYNGVLCYKENESRILIEVFQVARGTSGTCLNQKIKIIQEIQNILMKVLCNLTEHINRPLTTFIIY